MEESGGMRYSVGLDLDWTRGVQRGVEWGSEGWWDIGWGWKAGILLVNLFFLNNLNF